jgi:histidinol-phosphate aminotransferase
VKLPFEPGTPSAAAGIGALADKEFLHRTLELNARGIRLWTQSLKEMGLKVIPSNANFVMVELDSADQANAVVEDLLRQGVIIRPLAAFGIPQGVRHRGHAESRRALRPTRFGPLTPIRRSIDIS